MQLPLASSVIGGTGQLPDGDHTSHPVRPIAGRRKGAAHGFDFQKAKGRLPSSRAIFSRSSSLSTLRFATTDLSRRFSSSSTSTSRLFMPASPPARNRSRHCVRVAMVTRCLRDVASRSAPRSNSRTTDILRFADQRPPPAGADSGACSVALRAPCAAPESCLFPVDMGLLLHQILPIHCPLKFRAGPLAHPVSAECFVGGPHAA